MDRAASISPCGKFRWWLIRPCGASAFRGILGRVLWIMLNPSTADAKEDDPTIRRCFGFSTEWGAESFAVANSYAYRTPMPRDLRAAGYPIGDENDAHLVRLATECDFVIAAWGSLIQPERAAAVHRLISPIRPLHALRLTKHGQPSHPLYLPGDLRPFQWRVAA